MHTVELTIKPYSGRAKMSLVAIKALSKTLWKGLVLTALLLCASPGSSTPIIDNNTCIPPGAPCTLSGQVPCCPGFLCIQTSLFEKAYCVQRQRPPFIKARTGTITDPPRFMGMDASPPKLLQRRQEPYAPGNPDCCKDSNCRDKDPSCARGYNRDDYGTKACQYEDENSHECANFWDCCEGYYCGKNVQNGSLGKQCVLLDDKFQLPVRPQLLEKRLEMESIALDTQIISCQSSTDCPDDYRCSHGNEGTIGGVCTAPKEHHGWLINRSESEVEHQVKEEEKPKFPEFPTAWCTQEGCPCYYTSPCEMGVCDDYDYRMIGTCRKFRLGEDDDLQPGFPIDTVRCTYTGCPCNKWYDHCFQGACDGVNRPGYGKCRPFNPMEEPKSNRRVSDKCTDVGCVCDRDDFPCKNSQCVFKGVNKYGRCRRIGPNGRILHTRGEMDTSYNHPDCPCRKGGVCAEDYCLDPKETVYHGYHKRQTSFLNEESIY